MYKSINNTAPCIHTARKLKTTGSTMFPPSIVFLFALAFAGAAVMDLGKREVFEEEDDVDNGPAIMNQNMSKFWQYKKCCGFCRDPDELTYDLRKIRVNYPCMYNVTADLNNLVQVFMLTKPTGWANRSLTARVDILYNNVNYSFFKEDCTERVYIDPPGGYEPIPYDDSDVHIYDFDIADRPWMIFRIKAVYFEVSWDCQSCIYICVAHSFDQIMKGLCGNNNNNPADDDWGQGPDYLIAKYWQYYPCPPNGGYVLYGRK